MNIWLAATLRALFILGLGVFFIFVVESNISWIFVGFMTIFAFFSQLYFSKRRREKEKV
ncbi:hypothetical protein JCM19047_2552 [Bacillus sp. JCM 19047]|uniref:hypothetical protein n=1 Tax=Shouchella miscanthi TaxID=2598861 RepID=UPI0003EFD7AF|nr:hypothetical protein [Shouchella miscanthi]GAF22779.1 hypothetical protein JCM19047_2552 [Bacillus sp. JCM 19047]